MPEFSLDQLTSDREGVVITQIDLTRQSSSLITDDEFNALSLPDGRAYALGENREQGATYFLLRVSRALPREPSAIDEWRITWDRVPRLPIPSTISTSSEKAGGSAAVERRVGARWAQEPQARVSFSITYQLDEKWTTPWISKRSKSFGAAGRARARGAFWDVEDAPPLTGFSVLELAHLSLFAFGETEVQGWPDVPRLEAELWHALEAVVKEKSR